MFKTFSLIALLSASSDLVAQDYPFEQLIQTKSQQSVALEALVETPSETKPNRVLATTFSGVIEDDLYSAVLRDTNNEFWAEIMARSFAADLVTAKGLRVKARYTFNIDNSVDNLSEGQTPKILSAALQVGRSLVLKETKSSEESEGEVLTTKMPDEELRVFTLPVKVERISSQFNLARRHPVKRRRIQPHNGVDFAAKSGTPIYPALDGIITSVGRARAKGRFIEIEHANGMKTTYAHLRKFKKGLRVGDYVQVDDEIGQVGRSGYATGAHLHFALMNTEGYFVNPVHYFKEMVEPEALDDFNESDIEGFEEELDLHEE